MVEKRKPMGADEESPCLVRREAAKGADRPRNSQGGCSGLEALDLRRPIYRQTAAYGHFGRLDIELPWEQLDRIEALQKAV